MGLRGALYGFTLARLLATTTAVAGDDENSDRLDVLETELRETADARNSLGAEAAAIADELDLLRARMLASEQEIRELEDGLEEISETLVVLQEELAIQELAFAQQRDQLGDVLASLQRIARQPAEMLIAMPTSPTDTHRTAMLLAAITPELDRRAAELGQTMRSLAELRDGMAYQEAQRLAGLSAIRVEQGSAAEAALRKGDLLAAIRRDDETLAQRQDELMREAESLKDLFAGLQSDADITTEARDTAMSVAIEALAATSFSAQKGSLPLPTQGEIVVRFRQDTGNGALSDGIALNTPSGSRLVTPYDGQVVYAGPFSDYGHLLIIDHGEGYHTVLAGFARADVVLGQWLLAGEPVGVMATEESGEQLLYVELRRNGDPINPLPWIAARDNEVSGG